MVEETGRSSLVILESSRRLPVGEGWSDTLATSRAFRGLSTTPNSICILLLAASIVTIPGTPLFPDRFRPYASPR
jgi:hypothetical protein